MALKERLSRIVSVTTQFAISRRVCRFKLQLRDLARMQEKIKEDGTVDPCQWRGDGVWTWSRN